MTIASAISSGQEAVNNAGMSASDYLNRLTSSVKMKPKGMDGIGGFLFDYESETSVTLAAEITDHYAENGTVLNDHRVTKPLKVTLRGFIGEVIFRKQAGLTGLISLMQSKLGVVNAYLGHYTPQALNKVQAVLTQSQTVINKVNDYADKTKNIVSMFQKGAPGQTKQQKAYASLKAMFEAGTLFTIEKNRSPKISVNTPWTLLDDMMIETVVFTQGEDTKYATDISVTLKQVRLAETQTGTVDPTQFQARAQDQSAPQADKGITKGSTANVSALLSIFSGGR